MEDKNTADKIDIFIITNNRAERLDNTLKEILADGSPIKNSSITIIDNNSYDNTESVVKKYLDENSNLIYEKNKYNIGGNANIVKAFYKAKKEYVWVLADNDSFSWDSWGEVEKAIEEHSDAIIVALYECPKYDIAQLFIQTTFVPGVIYKTSSIDDTVMINMEFNISNLFPHLALSSKIINENKKFFIVSKAIILMGDNSVCDGDHKYIRGYDYSSVHPLQKSMNWITGYANSLHMIKDKNVRNYIVTHNRFCTELNSAKLFFLNPKEAEKNLYSYLCIFAVLSMFDKFRFLLNLVLFFSLYKIIFIYKQEFFDYNKSTLQTIYMLKLFSSYEIRLLRHTRKIKQ